MDALLEPTLERRQQRASHRWDTLSQQWSIIRRCVPLVLILVVLVLVTHSISASRPAIDLPVEASAIGTASQASGRGSERARTAGLTWVKARRAERIEQTLEKASWTGADLRGADLRGANLSGAALLGTHLRDANLAGAALQRADLHYAVLIDADLRNADLRWANLQWADLQDADLRGAQLAHARLDRAYLRGAILPDGTEWRPDRDLARFTDPAHPEYWKGTVE